jgi:hypothetical protein
MLAGCSLTRPLGYLTDHADEVDAGPWCAQNFPDASVCVDFDEGSLTHAFQGGADATIDAPHVDDGGGASLTEAAFASTMGPVAGNEPRYARFEEPLSPQGDWQKATLQFEMRLAQFEPLPQAEVDFASLHMHPADGGGAARAFFAMDSSGKGFLVVDQENGSSASQTVNGLFDNSWHTYSLSLELSSTSLAASLQVDNGDTVSATRAPVFDTAIDATFYLGIGVYGPSKQPVEVDFDNVLLLPKK